MICQSPVAYFKGAKPRFILHIDADAFFASVEEVLNPHLKNQAIIVGDARFARSVVSSANYIARNYGIRSAMPINQALQLCPSAKVVCSGFDHYRDFSRKIFNICRLHTQLVEQTSIDEAYLDLSSNVEDWCQARALALKIITNIKEATNLSVSAGLSGSKLVSKIASSVNKPHKLTCVPVAKEADFLSKISINDFPGVGVKSAFKYFNAGFITIGDLARADFDKVISALGKSGIDFWLKANGLDFSKVFSESRAPKSISQEYTFQQDKAFLEVGHVLEKMLIPKCIRRLEKNSLKCASIFIKIRYLDFTTITRTTQLINYTSNFEVLTNELLKLFYDKCNKDKKIRLIGAGFKDFSRDYNTSFF
jgi:DNA polymerase-4